MLPPRVLVVWPERVPRALLRAELREAGYDAIGASSLATALRYPPAEPERGPVGLWIVDQAALDAAAGPLLALAATRYPESRFLLVARAGLGAGGPGGPGGLAVAPPGGWSLVLRRPVTIGAIVGAARTLVPLPRALQRPIDNPDAAGHATSARE
jgi:hypothetical protein